MTGQPKMKIRGIILGALIWGAGLIWIDLGSVVLAQATNPTLSLSASSSTVYVGDTVAVNILINSASVASNAYQVNLSYPSSLITVQSAETGGSICQFWPMLPSYNDSMGRLDMQCGLPSPGYQGTGGQLLRVQFRANQIGTATVQVLNSSEVYGNDGSGNNIIGGVGSVTINIIAAPYVPPAGVPDTPSVHAGPNVSSPSHLDPNTWYSNDQVMFLWESEAEVSGYSYVFNQEYLTEPDESAETYELTTEFVEVSDGIWYFHIRSQKDGVWSETSRVKVQVDSTPPNDFIPLIKPEGILTMPNASVFFNTTDDVSGIQGYEVRVDNEEYQPAESPFETIALRSGAHIVYVKAIDLAGNVTYGKGEILISEVGIPRITSTKANFLFGEEIIVEGTASPESTIRIYKDSYEQLIATTTTDAFGHWQVAIPGFTLLPGKHTIFATAVDDHTHIESQKSLPYKVNVMISAIRLWGITIPWWFILLVLVSFTALILILLFILLRAANEHRKRMIARLRQFQLGVHKELDEFEEELEHELEEELQDVPYKKRARIEKEFEEKAHMKILEEEKKIDKRIEEMIDVEEDDDIY